MTNRVALTLIIVPAALTVTPAAWGQVDTVLCDEHATHHMSGRVVKYVKKHGSDHRIFSPILGMPRDLAVYLPPAYSADCQYPLILFFHMADVDEQYFVGSKLLKQLDDMIVRGEFPPAVVACPDGSYDGWHQLNAKHSLYVNGLGGRFKDHILQEVIPFITANYAIRPERQAHALVGCSAGGYGAMSLAIEHRDYFGAVATLAAPLNLRYSNCNGDYFENFNPLTYRWKTRYDPNEVIGNSYAGLVKVPRKFMEPVFGEGEAVANRITISNPADLIFSTNLQPGELAIYISYPGRDNFNFDAQAESFRWLAAQRGITVTVACDPKATHSLRYFRDNMRPSFLWLSQNLLAPAPLLQPAVGSTNIQD